MNEIIIVCAAIIYSMAINLSTRLICYIRRFYDASTVMAASHHLSSLALLGWTFLEGNNIKYQPGKNSPPVIY